MTMKKIMFILILLAAGTVITNAQFEKGSFMMGASSGINLHSAASGSGLATIGFSNVSSTQSYVDGDIEDDYKTSSFSILPQGAYFIMDNFAAGAGINYSRSTEEYDYEGTEKSFTTIFSFEPFVRYYFPLKYVTPFAQASVGFGGVYDKYESEGMDEPNKNKSPLSTFAGGVGASLPIGMNASFDVMAGYTHLKSTFEDEFSSTTYKQGTFGINLGFKIFLGGYGSSADASY